MDNQQSNQKKGKSKRAEVLVAAVQQATQNFVQQGALISREVPEAEEDVREVLDAVKSSGWLVRCITW